MRPAEQSARFGLLISPDAVEAFGQVAALDPEALWFQQLPLAVTSAPRDVLEKIAAVPGLVDIVPLPDVLLSLVAGINELLTIKAEAEAENSSHDGQRVIGGRAATENVGYPILEFIEGEPRLNTDPDVTWPTKPASMVALNLSIGPADPRLQFSPTDAVSFATYFAAQHVVVVMAAGNDSQRADQLETMSAWAEAPWVVAVGATSDRAGTELARYSSVGTPGINESGPDVVAWGASRVDEATVGTSFAAPRVAQIVSFFAAAIFMIRHYMDQLAGEKVGGVPLTGLAVIDSDYSPIPRDLLALPALPAFGIDEAALRESLAALDKLGAKLDVTCTPERLRAMLRASARPMPGYAPHQVGAGFVDEMTTERYLELFSGAHLGWLFGSERLPSEELSALSEFKIFEAGAPRLLFELVRRSSPVWLYDYATAQVSLSWVQAEPSPNST